MNGSGLELDLDQPACPRLVDSGVYLLGALSPPERADYAAHLTTCRACQREVEALASVASLLSRTTAAATGHSTASAGEHRPDREHQPARRTATGPRRWPNRFVAVLVAAALCGAVALVIGLPIRSSNSATTTRDHT